MKRTISIVLIAAIALQTIGCSTGRHVTRMNQVVQEDRPSSMRERILEELKVGMHARIRIREGTGAPITGGQVIECIIVKIGQGSLTVAPVKPLCPCDRQQGFNGGIYRHRQHRKSSDSRLNRFCFFGWSCSRNRIGFLPHFIVHTFAELARKNHQHLKA